MASMHPLLRQLALIPALALAAAPLSAQAPRKPVPPTATSPAPRAARPAAYAAADSTRADTELDEVGLRYAPMVRSCYEREGLRRDPTLGGMLEVSMTVLPGGAVREVSVDTTGVRGVGMSAVSACVSQSAAGWRFSSGPFGVERVAIPFSLVPPADSGGDRTSAHRG